MIASRITKYLEIHLTKEAQALYTENYKILLKEIKKTQINGTTPLFTGLEDLMFR